MLSKGWQTARQALCGVHRAQAARDFRSPLVLAGARNRNLTSCAAKSILGSLDIC